MANFNDDLPSSADPLVEKHLPDNHRSAIDDAVKAVEDAATFMKDRSARAYQRSNDALAARLSPLQGLLLAAAVGFAAGWLCNSRR